MASNQAHIESLILHGDRLTGTPETAGAAFEFDGYRVRFDGWGRRQVWSDAEDGWVWQYAPSYTILGDARAPVAAAPARYAIRSDFGKGSFAIVGKIQSSASTGRAEKATIFASRAEAEAALPALAEAAPNFFGPIHDPVVVKLP